MTMNFELSSALVVVFKAVAPASRGCVEFFWRIKCKISMTQCYELVCILFVNFFSFRLAVRTKVTPKPVLHQEPSQPIEGVDDVLLCPGTYLCWSVSSILKMNVPLCLRAKGSYRVLSARLLCKGLVGQILPLRCSCRKCYLRLECKITGKSQILNKVL